MKSEAETRYKKLYEEERQQKFEEQDKAFDDFLKGKEPEKKPFITDDMNIQDIFKKLYTKAHDADIKDQFKDQSGGIVNSARSSMNSFSARLEARRKAAREAKK